MDYPFFIGKIGVLSESTVNQLMDEALRIDGFVVHRYFRHDPDQLLSNKRLPWATVADLPADLRAVLKDAGLDGLALAVASLNRVDAGSHIREHSDLNSGGSLAWRKTHRHIVHVPVLNLEAEYLHRRTTLVKDSVFKMSRGGVYLYNNYVWHTVENRTAEPRVNLLLELDDPEWTTRDHVLSQFGIGRGGGQYETTNYYPVK